MKPLPTLHQITTPVRRIHPDTLRLLALEREERHRELTHAERIELAHLSMRFDERMDEGQGLADQTPTPAEIDELARLDHARRHNPATPHEL